MPVQVVSYAAVLRLHERAVEETGGLPGVRDNSQLMSALQRPHAGYGDVELFPTLFEKAAAVAHAIAAWHPFVDGNKRTGLLAAAATLHINGWELDASEEETVQAMLALAQSQMSVEEFAAWLEEHSFPLVDMGSSGG